MQAKWDYDAIVKVMLHKATAVHAPPSTKTHSLHLRHIEPAAGADPHVHILGLAQTMLLVGRLHVDSDPVHRE
jgi:hypothetical protein